MRTFLVTRRLIQLDSDPRVWLHSAINHDVLREPQADTPASPQQAKKASQWRKLGGRQAHSHLGEPNVDVRSLPRLQLFVHHDPLLEQQHQHTQGLSSHCDG